MSTTTSSPVDPTIDVQGNHEFQTVVQLHNNTIAKIASGSTLTFNNALDLNGQVLTKTGDGALVFNNQLLTSGGMVLGLEGTIGGAGTIGGDLDNQSGTVSPGGSSITAATQVPEPTSCLLLAAGALVISFTFWSRGGFHF